MYIMYIKGHVEGINFDWIGSSLSMARKVENICKLLFSSDTVATHWEFCKKILVYEAGVFGGRGAGLKLGIGVCLHPHSPLHWPTEIESVAARQLQQTTFLWNFLAGDEMGNMLYLQFSQSWTRPSAWRINLQSFREMQYRGAKCQFFTQIISGHKKQILGQKYKKNYLEGCFEEKCHCSS